MGAAIIICRPSGKHVEIVSCTWSESRNRHVVRVITRGCSPVIVGGLVEVIGVSAILHGPVAILIGDPRDGERGIPHVGYDDLRDRHVAAFRRWGGLCFTKAPYGQPEQQSHGDNRL